MQQFLFDNSVQLSNMYAVVYLQNLNPENPSAHIKTIFCVDPNLNPLMYLLFRHGESIFHITLEHQVSQPRV